MILQSQQTLRDHLLIPAQLHGRCSRLIEPQVWILTVRQKSDKQMADLIKSGSYQVVLIARAINSGQHSSSSSSSSNKEAVAANRNNRQLKQTVLATLLTPLYAPGMRMMMHRDNSRLLQQQVA